mgnify:FL=1
MRVAVCPAGGPVATAHHVRFLSALPAGAPVNPPYHRPVTYFLDLLAGLGRLGGHTARWLLGFAIGAVYVIAYPVTALAKYGAQVRKALPPPVPPEPQPKPTRAYRIRNAVAVKTNGRFQTGIVLRSDRESGLIYVQLKGVIGETAHAPNLVRFRNKTHPLAINPLAQWRNPDYY